jgi:two-component system, NtrC family, response regulator AlgB
MAEDHCDYRLCFDRYCRRSHAPRGHGLPPEALHTCPSKARCSESGRGPLAGAKDCFPAGKFGEPIPCGRFYKRQPPHAASPQSGAPGCPDRCNGALRGESGTGKTVLARAIHGWSKRAEKPFAVVSCPSLSAELLESELFGHIKGAFTGAVRDNPGRIAVCEGGTLFLDEIGDLPLSLQPKLMRFLQDREFERVGEPITRKANVRIITATSTNLEEAVKEGKFREALLYRLNVIQIEIPPLRERLEDVGRLAMQLLSFYGSLHHRRFLGFTDEAAAALKSYSWPGNVRELRNVIERAAILCQSSQVGAEHLPEKLPLPSNSPQVGDPVSLDRIEEEHVRRVLAAAKSLQEAADILGIDQATLWRRRKQYGI